MAPARSGAGSPIAGARAMYCAIAVLFTSGYTEDTFFHRVTAVGNAGDALAHLPSQAWDVLLSGIEWPGMSGVEWARQARAAAAGLPAVRATSCRRAASPAAGAEAVQPEHLQAALLALA